MNGHPFRLALVIGHTPDAPGACNRTHGICEYQFNAPLARSITTVLHGKVDVDLVYRDRPNDYRGLPGKINALHPNAIVSLHANGGPPTATGSEALYWHTSDNGRRLAAHLLQQFVLALDLRDRGVKPRGSMMDRGGHLLRHTKAPCVIAEPFFISNDFDLERALTRMSALTHAYADGIASYVKETLEKT